MTKIMVLENQIKIITEKWFKSDQKSFFKCYLNQNQIIDQIILPSSLKSPTLCLNKFQVSSYSSLVMHS